MSPPAEKADGCEDRRMMVGGEERSTCWREVNTEVERAFRADPLLRVNVTMCGLG